MTLTGLEALVARDLEWLDWGGADWTVPRGDDVYDVLIVGGGQSGLGAAFALIGERVNRILVLDENPAGREGPWATYARMRTLRTPKHLTGIDMGIPSLTFRAWYEAQFGTDGWDALGKIPRPMWMDYLRWYRRVLDLPVRNEAKVVAIDPAGAGLFRVTLADGSALTARKVVLATGIQGGGEWHVPAFVSDALPPHLYAHTSAGIDYAALAGKRIGVLGIGASAFDNANAALEAGVAEVHVFARREALPRVNPIRFMERVGMTPRYPALADADKYRAMRDFLMKNQPPTTDMFEAASAHPGFALHLGSPWLSVEAAGPGARVTTPGGTFDFDFLVLSTGLLSDPALRPELGGVADRIARWSDRYTPPPGQRHPLLDAHPYLGPAFELLPRRAEDAAALHGLFAFNYSALASIGLSAAALSGLRHALPRLAKGVADQLFRDDAGALVDAFIAYDEPEFAGQWPRGVAA
ncbi:NAD(P)/FAD-dependent oxidoreductase [uncultured Sphingomonas sp.]|uniref:FAD/NAD(P)-binding protein n=1 Tax=uncultured Sphingomonas sp. TaxID=158754 RepID=UPI00258F2003|nr:NAD(P)/FAD-dependent oxidoreductase [uncultured Sphingomonas sp.]